MVSIVIIKTFVSKAIGELFVETFEIFRDTQITFNVQVNKRTQSISELTKKQSINSKCTTWVALVSNVFKNGPVSLLFYL